MKKLSFLVCILIFSFLTSCKNNQNPILTTLAERAGTYTGAGSTVNVIVTASGNITFSVAGAEQFDPNSTETTFYKTKTTYIVFLNEHEINYHTSNTDILCTKQ